MELLWYQVAVRCQMCCVKMQEIIRSLLAGAVSDEGEGSLAFELGNCSDITDGKGWKRIIVCRMIVVESALTKATPQTLGNSSDHSVFTAVGRLVCSWHPVWRASSVLEVDQKHYVMC